MSLMKVLLLLALFVIVAEGFALTRHTINRNSQLKFSRGFLSNFFRPHMPTVTHYARHTLCKTSKAYLYKALRTKFCDITPKFTEELVIDLCRRQDYLLDKWVAELFDVDGDGYITHDEKQLYRIIDD